MIGTDYGDFENGGEEISKGSGRLHVLNSDQEFSLIAIEYLQQSSMR